MGVDGSHPDGIEIELAEAAAPACRTRSHACREDAVERERPALPPKQIAKFPVGSGPYWAVPSQDGMMVFIACPGSDEMVVFDVAAKKEKMRFTFPAGDRPTRMIDLAVPIRPQTSSR